jgi:hypothetical protein
MLLLGALTAPLHAAAGSEEKVKAAFLHRLLYYIEYPATAFASPTAPYVIGVMEDELVAEELARLTAGKLINNRPAQVVRIPAGGALDGLHLLFIGRSERARQPYLLKQLRNSPVFRVTEIEGSLEQGSMFNFRIVDDKVRFEVSIAAAEQAGLRLSSRLLALAIYVVKANP